MPKSKHRMPQNMAMDQAATQIVKERDPAWPHQKNLPETATTEAILEDEPKQGQNRCKDPRAEAQTESKTTHHQLLHWGMDNTTHSKKSFKTNQTNKQEGWGNQWQKNRRIIQCWARQRRKKELKLETCPQTIFNNRINQQKSPFNQLILRNFIHCRHIKINMEKCTAKLLQIPAETHFNGPNNTAIHMCKSTNDIPLIPPRTRSNLLHQI